jgi:simple sugar transport system ATP-binding protein
VELRGVTVRYGDLVADRDVSLAAGPREIHALVGENGAGKSTLMRALFGLTPLSAGEVRIGGERVARPTPAAMMARGVGMVHQHSMLVEALTVDENVTLGDEPIGLLGALDARRAAAEVAAGRRLAGGGRALRRRAAARRDPARAEAGRAGPDPRRADRRADAARGRAARPGAARPAR